MAQNRATVLVEGRVVKSERKNGSFADREDPTRNVTFDFIEARVLTSSFDTIDVRFPSDGSIAVPPIEQDVRLRCEVRPSMGSLKLTVLSVESALVSAAASKG
ncbi:hypothetical protein GALL_248610 [mine drainage metagenome]|uniref:Uncharacterized protein n=1 Tax=mine drainage metagenome TaxID=410659 RepID=A0A1J5RUL3_9ZZZZ